MIARKHLFWIIPVILSFLICLYLFQNSCLFSKCGDSVSSEEELRIIQEKAVKGDRESLVLLYKHYSFKRDDENMKKWLIIGANAKDSWSTRILFSFYGNDRLTYSDTEFAAILKKMEALADQGDVNAIYSLGRAYLTGDGLSIDIEAGKAWLRKGSAKNDPGSTYVLANFLLENPSGQSDRDEAKKLLEKLLVISGEDSANMNFAKNNLAIINGQNGRGKLQQ